MEEKVHVKKIVKPETLQLMKESCTHKQAVDQFTRNDEFVKRWESVSAINRELGFARQNILKACNEEIPTAYNYKWQYA